MTRIYYLIYFLLVTFSSYIAANQTINPNAPNETQQFAQLLGKWQVKDFQLQKDGSWKPGKGADWNWYTILDGHAIQDDWISPSMGTKVENSQRQFGTNIRIYNPKLERWELAWASKFGQQVDTFTAKKVGNDLQMLGLFSGTDSKITFFEITPTSFRWKLETRKSETDKWLEVYRIEGVRKRLD